MITTPDLIDALVANAAPVRRLGHPLARAALWLVVVALILALLAISQGMRPDLVQRLQQPVFAVGIAASLLTGVLAAVASFLVSLPGRSRSWMFLPLPALGVWLSTLSYGCLTNWVSLEPEGIALGETARCFATLVLTSLPLSLVMLLMLRHAALFRPTMVACMGSLAVAAITASALPLFHNLDASAMVLAWNVGTAVLIVGLASLFARRMLSWVAPRSVLDQR